MDRSKGFGFYLDKTLKTFQQSYIQEFERNQIDLSLEEWAILERIHLHGGVSSQSEIAKTNYRNRATTSRIISSLVEKNMITKGRFENDLKRFKLEVTEKGNEMIQKVMPLVQRLRSISYDGIEDYEFEVFLKILNKIEENHRNIN